MLFIPIFKKLAGLNTILHTRRATRLLPSITGHTNEDPHFWPVAGRMQLESSGKNTKFNLLHNLFFVY